MSIPHPIPYQGSKRNLARSIMQYFPDNIDTLIEPFAGSAALSLAAAYHTKARRFILSDINEPLIHLWHDVINGPDRLADYYEKLWYAQQGRERRFYDLIRKRFNQTSQPYYLLYLLARCVKASIRYNANGEFNQSPDNRRKGRNPVSMRRDIVCASILFKSKTCLMSADYTQIVQYAGQKDLIYLDPPYQGVSSKRDPRYIQGIEFDQFVDFLTDLNSRGLSYIVSYDGRTGNRRFGNFLPETLGLTHIEIEAGRSSQSTLLGQTNYTYESLYLSPQLVTRLSKMKDFCVQPKQLPLIHELI